jgi:hypothetical protein
LKIISWPRIAATAAMMAALLVEGGRMQVGLAIMNEISLNHTCIVTNPQAMVGSNDEGFKVR